MHRIGTAAQSALAARRLCESGWALASYRGSHNWVIRSVVIATPTADAGIGALDVGSASPALSAGSAYRGPKLGSKPAAGRSYTLELVDLVSGFIPLTR